MQSSFERRFCVASTLILSSFLASSSAALADDGLASIIAAPVKASAKIVGTVLEGGGTAASAVIKTGGSAASAVAKLGDKESSSRKDEKEALSDKAESSEEKAKEPKRDHRAVGRNFPVLQGEVSTSHRHTPVSQSINNLVAAGLAKDERTETLDKAVKHYSKISSKVMKSAGNSINFAVPNRGFNPSIEAGNVATGENVEIKSLAAAELARQKHIDEMHVKVVASVMQIATGLGMSDQTKGQQKVDRELENLRGLVGEEQASNTLETLKRWGAEQKVEESAFNQELWDVHEQREKKLAVMTTALNSDPVVAEVMGRLHKFNRRSKFARTSSRVIQTTLGTIALGPDFVGVGGKVALGAFVAATGGPEQDKIIKEMYLGERLDSRSNVLNAEIQMAMENYQLAKLTRNHVLMAASQAVVQQMAGPELVPEVFGAGTDAREVSSSTEKETL